jgi:hypothetical protein
MVGVEVVLLSGVREALQSRRLSSSQRERTEVRDLQAKPSKQGSAPETPKARRSEPLNGTVKLRILAM